MASFLPASRDNLQFTTYHRYLMKKLSKLLLARLPLLIFGIWAITGGMIFCFPVQFYNLTPGVSSYGPYNTHFIRDIGLIYFSSGLIGIYGLRISNAALCIAGTAWSLFHGIFHLHLWVHRGLSFDGLFLFDLSVVIMPPFFIIFTAKKIFIESKRIL